MLTETYRPKTWAEVVGQDKVIRQLDRLRARGLAGRAYWISGQSGTGKTTIARLLAADMAQADFTQEVDAQGFTVADCERADRSLQFKAWGNPEKTGRVLIVNEAHGLRRDVIRYLLVALERIPIGAAWIFTTTNDGMDKLFDDYADATPLLSRCLQLKLARQGLAKPMAAALQAIAQRENLDGQPIAKYVDLIQDCKNNMRMALQRIESGEMLV